jgi:hypothetical protein
MWHTHFDWDGRGNEGQQIRQEYLGILFAAYHRALEQVEAADKITQIFVSVCDGDSSQDALYVNRPGGTPAVARYTFPGFEPVAETPQLLAQVLPEPSEHQVLQRSVGEQLWYVVRQPEEPSSARGP